MKHELDPSFRKNGKWDVHAAPKTVNHIHFSVYDSDPSVDLMIVETEDGKFYIGESFSGDGRGHDKVFCESGESGIIELYDTLSEAKENIFQVLSELTGFSIERLKSSMGYRDHVELPEEVVCTLENEEEWRDFIYRIDPNAQITVSGIITHGEILSLKLGDFFTVKDGKLAVRRAK